MVEAVEKSGVPNLVWYNYRFLPAVTLAKNIVDAGELGRIFHYRANFLQDWTISDDLPQGGAGLWRLDAAAAGSGVTGDLLAHCIDTARWINGDIVSVSAMTETFIKERVHTATGEKQAVTIDDACAFLARFENGSLAIFESTRYARGHKALYTFEINGENKSLAWDLHDLNCLSTTSTTAFPATAAAGPTSTRPTATIRTPATGGSPVFASATSTRSPTNWPSSSSRSTIRRPKSATRTSVTPSAPNMSATRSLNPPARNSGWTSRRRNPRKIFQSLFGEGCKPLPLNLSESQQIQSFGLWI